MAGSKLKLCTGFLTGKFADTIWYKAPARQANCYAFALNEPRAAKACPGRLTDQWFFNPDWEAEHLPRLLSPAYFPSYLEQDGLVPISEDEALSQEARKSIAAFLAPSKSFHFARKMPDGIWSHKFYGYHVNSLDDDRKEITNPAKARFNGYDCFAGYYTIPETGIPFVPRFSVKGLD